MITSFFGDEISDDFSEQLFLLKKHGVKNIDLRSIAGKSIIDFKEFEVEKIKMRLKEFEIKVSCLATKIGKTDIEDDFDVTISKLCHAISIAKILETNYIRVFSFYNNTSIDSRCFSNEVKKRLKLMVEVACENDIVLLLENEKKVYADTPEKCLDILDYINSDSLKLIFDPANFYQCNIEPFDALKKLQNYIEYVHIKDINKFGSIVPAGEGECKLREILKTLFSWSYSSYLSIEPHLNKTLRGGGEAMLVKTKDALDTLIHDI